MFDLSSNFKWVRFFRFFWRTSGKHVTTLKHPRVCGHHAHTVTTPRLVVYSAIAPLVLPTLFCAVVALVPLPPLKNEQCVFCSWIVWLNCHCFLWCPVLHVRPSIEQIVTNIYLTDQLEQLNNKHTAKEGPMVTSPCVLACFPRCNFTATCVSSVAKTEHLSM